MNEMNIVRQEIHCHECGRYVRFELDMSMNGNHVLNCPNCGHEHCRVVKDGRITGERWDSRNGSTYFITTASTAITSIYVTTNATSVTGGWFLSDSWLNSSTVTLK